MQEGKNNSKCNSLNFQCKKQPSRGVLKGTVMQIEKALINDRFHVLKAFSKFHIPAIHNFAVIYQ